LLLISGWMILLINFLSEKNKISFNYNVVMNKFLPLS
jgi:hypothetical protein